MNYVILMGGLQMEQWTAKDGTKRNKISLRAFDVQFLNHPQASDIVSADDEEGISPAQPPSALPPNPVPPEIDEEDPPF
jgi:single-stranded DNA-binding protein